MKLIAYTGSKPLVVRPAPKQRDWMSQTPDNFAYRCLPLNIANAHGWEILCPAAFEAVWNGKPGLNAIKIRSQAPENQRPTSHFGHGILTFHVNVLFRTEPGMNLWITGPVNRPKHGIYALTGVVETDWVPYTFTMNWRFTRSNLPVRFDAGDPFCFFFPIPRNVITSAEPEQRSLDEDTELRAKYDAWSDSRESFNKELPKKGTAANKGRWQKHYMRGSQLDGTPGPADHQTQLSAPPFVDRRAK